jgi:hypothetical protein
MQQMLRKLYNTTNKTYFITAEDCFVCHEPWQREECFVCHEPW